MEKEFDFKFPHDLYRKRLLGLKFMANEEIDSASNRTEVIILEEEANNKDNKACTEQDHLEGCSNATFLIYSNLRSRILALGDIVIEPMKQYIAFKRNTNVCDIQTQRSGQVKITINVNSGELNDPRHLAKDMETPQHIGHWGNGDYELVMTNLDDIDYVMSLIEQSYKIH